ncbi:MAG: hypothetical protein FJ270_08090 [Planctomycetes bacterium]|nr:hypothetical protein [Planctomycetota bacterium]
MARARARWPDADGWMSSRNGGSPASAVARLHRPAGVPPGAPAVVSDGARRSPDITGSGPVDGAEFSLLLAAWAQPGPTDMDWSSSTSGADLGVLLGAW